NPTSYSCVLCYHQAYDPMTCPINSIAGKKHQQLARQVGDVIKISSAGLMASFNINSVAFIPGKEFTFESFNFIVGIDGRLHVSDPEITQTGQTRSNSASRVIICPGI